MAYIRNAKKDKNDTCSCVIDGFIVLYDRGWQGEVLKHMKNDHFSFFRYF